MARQAVDGGEVVGIEAMLGAEDKTRASRANHSLGRFHDQKSALALRHFAGPKSLHVPKTAKPPPIKRPARGRMC
jgi:hypothetical protein